MLRSPKEIVSTRTDNKMPNAFRGSVNAEPSIEEIRERAFEIYVERGQQPGREVEDWVQAEQELRQRGNRRN